MFAAYAFTFVVACLFWILLMLDQSLGFTANILLVGFVVSALVSAISARHFAAGLKVSDLNPMRLAYAIVYLADFAYAELVSNVKMIPISLGLQGIRPAVLKIPLKTRNELIITGVSNSITLTPGTLTLDARDGFLYVHWITADKEGEGAKADIVGNFEKNLKRVFE
ncbi:MAG: Na+/H+ antiporter subunit E [Candidatus Micrarchaeota archaeon]|nr:Na+/H+ antiporter subunit E [Candidatus Micrarchaeota archaeon]